MVNLFKSIIQIFLGSIIDLAALYAFFVIINEKKSMQSEDSSISIFFYIFLVLYITIILVIGFLLIKNGKKRIDKMNNLTNSSSLNKTNNNSNINNKTDNTDLNNNLYLNMVNFLKLIITIIQIIFGGLLALLGIATFIIIITDKDMLYSEDFSFFLFIIIFLFLYTAFFMGIGFLLIKSGIKTIKKINITNSNLLNINNKTYKDTNINSKAYNNSKINNETYNNSKINNDLNSKNNEKIFITISCKNCGANQKVEKNKSIECEFCNTILFGE